MSRRYARPLTAQEIATIRDEDIDFSDIPEMAAHDWQGAEMSEPEPTRQVTLHLTQSVVDAFKAGGLGYRARMKTVLEAYVRRQRQKG